VSGITGSAGIVEGEADDAAPVAAGAVVAAAAPADVDAEVAAVVPLPMVLADDVLVLLEPPQATRASAAITMEVLLMCFTVLSQCDALFERGAVWHVGSNSRATDVVIARQALDPHICATS
jgi:hypothetical protein